MPTACKLEAFWGQLQKHKCPSPVLEVKRRKKNNTSKNWNTVLFNRVVLTLKQVNLLGAGCIAQC